MGKTSFHWVGPGLVIAGRYRIDALLGEGGYGAVYVATQLNLERQVALKLLHKEVLVRERARERFEREAKVTQQLAHPNIVRLFDFGTSEQGLPFIVCELLDGRSLEAEIKRAGPLPMARVAHITQQILKGLAEAHARGIVHRDVKPANIFLCDYAGETDFVKLLDFGIATAPLAKDAAGLTQEGVSLGTPAYMSPEQVLDQPLDGRADLYSVGLVMAEMMSGSAIFQGTGAMEVALRQIEQAPVPLSPALLSSPLGPFIHRATQKDANHRFGSALEMLEALRHLLAGMAHAGGSNLGMMHGTQGPSAAGPSRFASGQVPAAPTPHQPTPYPSHYAASLPHPAMPGGSPSQQVMPGGAAYPAAPAAPGQSSISMPIAAPAHPQPPPSRAALWVALGVFAALGIAGGTYAIAMATVRSAESKQVAQTPPSNVIPPVATVPQNAPTQRDPMDQLDNLDVNLADFLNVRGCHPLPPNVGSFSVRGLTLTDSVARAEAAGYKCSALNAFGPEWGNMTFMGNMKPSFQLHYLGRSAPAGTAQFPNSVTFSDPDTGRYYVIVGDSVEGSKAIGDILLGKK